jgi:hypothetical protein
LLKPASKYDVGRHKENALFINSKKISRQNGEIILGEHTEEDAVYNYMCMDELMLRDAIDESRCDSKAVVSKYQIGCHKS